MVQKSIAPWNSHIIFHFLFSFAFFFRIGLSSFAHLTHNYRLVGGGEAGPPTSYKLELLDSAHVEVMRIGTYRKDWGGLDREELLTVMTSGSILIPQIEVLPTDVVPNPDKPPELEIRFDMEEASPAGKQLENLGKGDFEAFCKEPLPLNWQLRFLHNQFFRTFVFPSRFCPGAFHSTILRKADFRSEAHRRAYFAKCATALANWRREGPKALNTIPRHFDTRPLTKEEIKAVQAAKDAENNLEKFSKALEKQNSQDTDFAEPTEEEAEAVAELVDKLAAMAPLPPAATTAKATANLEVSLDEATSSSDGEIDDDLTEDESGAPESTDAQESGEKDQATESETAEPCEGEKVASETTNDASPEVATTSEQQEELASGENDDADNDDKAGETEELPANSSAMSEAPTDEACASDGLWNNGSETLTLPDRVPTAPEDCHSGIWLFTDRANITHFFAPNFLPPYDTPEKRKIIFDVLKEEWDEGSLSWKPCGKGSMTKPKEADDSDGNVMDMVCGAVSAVMDGVCSTNNESAGK